MKKMLSIFMSVALFVSALSVNFSAFADTDKVPDNSAAEANDELGATEACDGHVLGTFSGVPACVNESGELHICENNFPDESFRIYVEKRNERKDGYWSEEQISRVKDVNLNNIGIRSMKGIEFFSKIRRLSCKGNQLTKLNVSNNYELWDFDCSENQLIELNVSKNSKLYYMNCSGNKLIELDISNCTELVTLDCILNQLTALDVSNNPQLMFLQCPNNQLTALDVSNNPRLESLVVQYNQLTELNVSNNSELKTLHCSYNQLTKLDVSNNPKLYGLYCSNNQLTELGLSSNPELTYLDCSNNQLTALNVSNNTYLITFNCSNNQLAEMDLTNNKILQTSYVEYSGNQVYQYIIPQDGVWKVDMSKIISQVNFNRINSLSNGDFNPDTGIITFEKFIPHFTYNYDVGKDGREMLVFVHLTEHSHTFSDWQVLESATCTKGGTEYRVCECGEEETRTIGPNGHTFGSWIVEKPASSEEDGLEYRICFVCQYKETHIIPADEYRAGDTDSDGVITSDDATYLLYHVFYPDDYPLN